MGTAFLATQIHLQAFILPGSDFQAVPGRTGMPGALAKGSSTWSRSAEHIQVLCHPGSLGDTFTTVSILPPPTLLPCSPLCSGTKKSTFHWAELPIDLP